MIAGLVVTEEQNDLQQGVRRFLAERAPMAAARAAADAGVSDPELWRRLCVELGLVGLTVAEQHGGSGAGWPEICLVLEEAGYALLAAPLLPALLATTALGACGDGTDLLVDVVEGRRTAALALSADGGQWRPASVQVVARQGLLHGTARFVLEGATADLLLVAAVEGDGLSLFAVDAGAAGLERTALPVLDRTRPLGDVVFAGTRARRLGDAGAAGPWLARTVGLCLVALAAEQVGLAQRALDDAVAHALARHQFGRPVGSFQAVKHLLAESLVLVESARSAVRYAAASIAEDAPDLELRASVVKAHCSEAAYRVTATSIQVHGGIGYTWEHDAHLLFKRATASAQLLGSPAAHRARVAELVGV